MAKNVKKIPRKACVVEGENGEYSLTDIGLAAVMELAGIGSEVKEIANYLRIHPAWLAQRLDEESPEYDQEIDDAFREGQHSFLHRLRTAQQNLADTNAQMAIHLGKQYLGQTDRREIDISAKMQIVGTLPDYSQTPEDWQRAFAPSAMQPLKVIEADAREAEDIDVLASNGDEDEARSAD